MSNVHVRSKEKQAKLASNCSLALSECAATSSNYMLSVDGSPLAPVVGCIQWILALWEASPLLNNVRDGSDRLVQEARVKLGNLRLPPPHLEDCAARAGEYNWLDSRNQDGSRPVWSLIWKVKLGPKSRSRVCKLKIRKILWETRNSSQARFLLGLKEGTRIICR